MNERTMQFFIEGTPAPGGSKTAIPIWKGGKLLTTIRNGRVWPIFNMIDAGGERNEQWRKDVAIQGRGFMRGAKPFACAVKVEFIFYIQRPLKHFVATNRSRPLRDDAPIYHVGPPDALKLARSTEDALTDVIWIDDSQSTRICSEKRWANPGEKAGCAVKLVLLPSAPA